MRLKSLVLLCCFIGNILRITELDEESFEFTIRHELTNLPRGE